MMGTANAAACAGPSCPRPVAWSGTGRPPSFCSDNCRKAAHRHKRQIERAEADRIEADRRAEAERHELAQVAGRLVLALTTNPGKGAMILLDWVERDDSRKWDLFRLERFVSSSSSSPASDERRRR